MTISYPDLIRMIRDESGGEFTLEKSRKALETVVAVFTDIMLEGNETRIPLWAKLGSKWKEGHKGRNPRTGEPIKIPGRMIPFFEASKKLRDEVAGI